VVTDHGHLTTDQHIDNIMDTTSLSLLDRVCRERNDEAWRLLAAIYTPIVQGWLRRYELQPSDADDLTQDVLLVVAREMPGFQHNGRPGAFRTWLRGILVNRLRHFWRSRKQRPAASGDSHVQRLLDQLEDPHSELSRQWDREHDRQVLRQLLAGLEGRFAESTRQAFRRVVLDGISPEAAAHELGLSVNAVVIAKCRVLKALRLEGRGLLGPDAA
jgi:RNA polymerase sigma-70 factor (ECF subfamily)